MGGFQAELPPDSCKCFGLNPRWTRAVQWATHLRMKPPTLLTPLFAVLAAPAAALAVDYETQVKPILKNACYECHGGPRAKRDIRMDVEEKFAEVIGPDRFIVPGKPEESRLVEVIKLPYEEEDRMPRPGPNKNQPLKAGEIAIIEQWVKEGASFEKMEVTAAPEPSGPDPEALHSWVSTSGTEIQAYFVKIDGASVVLRSEDGQEKSFPGAVFSKESQELAKQLAAATASAE